RAPPLSLHDALPIFAGPRRAIDALELLVAGVTTPVGAGDGRQTEGRDAPGRRHVRAAAEVHELALVVERDGVLGDALDDLDLVVDRKSTRLNSSHVA